MATGVARRFFRAQRVRSFAQMSADLVVLAISLGLLLVVALAAAMGLVDAAPTPLRVRPGTFSAAGHLAMPRVATA